MERILIDDTTTTTSEILVGRFGAAPGADVLLAQRSERERVALLTHDGATRVTATIEAQLRAAGFVVATRQLPDREAAKTLQTAEATFLWLNSLGMTRGDTLVAVGGGALTDAAGFIAATYLRGIEVVLVPTTLLGAVDAAVGGKTAVNVGGKNLVGVFRHPGRVVIDLDVLDGLPQPLLIEGTAEAVKAGLIADPELVDLYERRGLEAPLDEVVPRAVRVKTSVVGGDFREGGRRAILNYGHTVGHAIESAVGLPHGHAVAIGMVAAGAAAAEAVGFESASRQRRLLESLRLPVTAPMVDRRELHRLMALDKKRDVSGIRMVLLRDIGDPTVVTVDPATVDAALDAVGVD